ncbi:MAG: FG-GAP repeat protein, partial [Phycisphaerales bacterium]
MRPSSAAVLIMCLAPVAGVCAQPRAETGALLPGDPRDTLLFGDKVGLADGLALVSGEGVWTIPQPGGAYLFDVATRTQLAKLPVPIPADNDRLFIGSGIGPGRALVATRPWNFDPSYANRVWVYDITTPSAPTLVREFVPDDAQFGDELGESISVDGTVAAIGAPFNPGNGTNCGAVYLMDTATGDQIGKVVPSDGEGGDQFGYAVSLDGAMLLVGARWEDTGADQAGAAYLFDVTDPANPVELAKLTPPAPDPQDFFGFSVAVSGDVALVGAMFDDDLGLDSGAVYVYDISTPAAPVLAEKLLPSDGNATDDFGWSVAIDGNAAVVGSRTDDDLFPGAGSAYLFDMTDPATPVEAVKLVPSDTAANAVFGWSAAIEGDVALIGASCANDGANRSGKAYLFDASIGAPCLADTNGNGVADPGDFTAWVAAYNAND